MKPSRLSCLYDAPAPGCETQSALACETSHFRGPASATRAR